MTRVLICVDSFKGSIDSKAAANSIADGWSAIRPADQIETLAFADGGEGTLDAVHRATPGSRLQSVTGQDSNREISFLAISKDTALVELARICGLEVDGRSDPHGASSYRLGLGIRQAIEMGHKIIWVGLGGSACSDGGAGAMQALGAKLLRADGSPIEKGNRGLSELRTVDLDDLLIPEGVSLILLTDVENPLLGPKGAIRVFSKQKGASESDFAQMEENLQTLSALLPETNPELPGSGAAGGTAFGLMALGGQIRSGARHIAELIGLESKIALADLVITGEGSFDSQTQAGKAVAIVAQITSASSKTCYLVAGQIKGDLSLFAGSVAISDLAPSIESSMQSASTWLQKAGEKLAGQFQSS